MSFDFVKPSLVELKPRISVIGVGGAGGNAVANMIADGLTGVDFAVANTDAQALAASPAETRIQLGLKITQGLGAGARPEIGAAAAEEAIGEIDQLLEGIHMCFITAGMGGGTGTGAAPVVARAARERGVLTVGVVTKPFAFEGLKRMRAAEDGIAELQRHVDTLLIIPNQNLFLIANQQTTFKQAFAMADQVLNHGVRGITDLMVLPGLINLDFADVRTVMSEMGKAMMGTGEAEGERRAIEAAEKAISNPLLDEVSLRGAKAVIINITGGEDLGLMEVEEAAQHIREMVDPDANIIVGSAFSNDLDGRMRVSVVATGIESTQSALPGMAAGNTAARPGTPGGGIFGSRTNNAAATPATAAPAPASAAASAEPAPVVANEASEPAASQPEAVDPAPAEAVESQNDEVFELDTPVESQPAPAAKPNVSELPLGEPAGSRVRPAPMPEPEPEPRKLTLFERMIALSRKPKVEPVAETPEQDRSADDATAIPPFFRQQRN